MKIRNAKIKNTGRDYLQNISPVPKGFIVRKQFNGEIFQKFFGYSDPFDVEDTLQAAIDYRDELLEETADAVSLQTRNVNNKTGVVGVSLCVFRVNESNIMLNVRYQRPEQGKTVSGSFSVKTHGLWHAFESAVKERKEIVLQQKGFVIDAEQAFDVFMQHYMDRMTSEQDEELKVLMKEELAKVVLCITTPSTIRHIVVSHVLAIDP